MSLSVNELSCLEKSGLMPADMAQGRKDTTNVGIPPDEYAALSSLCRRRKWSRRGVVAQLVRHFLNFDATLQLLMLDDALPPPDRQALVLKILDRVKGRAEPANRITVEDVEGGVLGIPTEAGPPESPASTPHPHKVGQPKRRRQ
jgi:hypothetical protein